MKKRSVFVYTALLTLGCSGLTLTQTTYAAGFNPMNMMNPSKWFGGRDRGRGYYDDDYYYDRYYDRWGGPGYGYGRGWGPGWGGYGPGYGYGWPGYGYGYGPGYGYGAPGYGARNNPAPAPLPQ